MDTRIKFENETGIKISDRMNGLDEREYNYIEWLESQLTTQSARIRELEGALENLTDLVADIETTLFHHNHSIVGYHLSGAEEPIMNFVSDFDMDAQKQALLLSIRLKKEALRKTEKERI